MAEAIDTQINELSKLDGTEQQISLLQEEKNNLLSRGQIELGETLNKITLTRLSDVTTIKHELMHHWSDIIDIMAARGNKKAKALKAAKDSIIAKNKEYVKQDKNKADEVLSEAYEAWLYTGVVAESPAEQKLFDAIKKYFQSVYESVRDITGIRINPEIDTFFRQMTGMAPIEVKEDVEAELNNNLNMQEQKLKDILQAHNKELPKKWKYYDNIPSKDVNKVIEQYATPEEKAEWAALSKRNEDLTAELNRMNKQQYFQPLRAGLDVSQKVKVVDLTNTPVKNKKELKSFINTLIDHKEATADGGILKFVKTIKRTGKKAQKVDKHIVYSSFSRQGSLHNKAVNSILALIKNSVLVEEGPAKAEKKDYDKVYRFYVPVKIKEGIFAVRLVALHNKNNKGMNITGDIYDVIIEEGPIPNQQLNASERDKSTIILKEMLANVKDMNGNPYILPIDKNNTPTVLSQIGYHGTPHRFERFSTEHIGTGTGMQAHGWGLYFAKNKKEAQFYCGGKERKNLFYGGQPLLDSLLKMIKFKI